MIKERIASRNIPVLRSREEMLEVLLEQEYGKIPALPEKTEWIVEKNKTPGIGSAISAPERSRCGHGRLSA